MALADHQVLVDALVRDDTGKLSASDRDEAIARAVARYGRDRPRRLVEDVTAAGGNLLDLPAGWEDGFSVLESLEYPIGAVPPTLLTGWRLYRSPSATRIMTAGSLPAGAVLRATYTARHMVGAAADTVSAEDREAVAAWAAALLLDQLASLFSGDSDSTIGADSVEHAGKAESFAARAGRLRRRYFDELGMDPKRTVAAGVVVDLDPPDSRGRDRLTHPPAYR